MTKITISQVTKALPKIKEGLAKYNYLICNVHKPGDSEFQQVYRDFFKFRGALAKKANSSKYFKYMQECMKKKNLKIEEVLKRLYGDCGVVTPSFASKLLSMVNPDMPVLDSVVRKNLRELENLDIKLAWHSKPEERIKRGIAAYEEIRKWYENHFKTGKAKEWIKLFDEEYRESKNKITDVKKIDLILWQIRD